MMMMMSYSMYRMNDFLMDGTTNSLSRYFGFLVGWNSNVEFELV